MKRRVGLAGFTIVETMIVLAVTGALFVAIAGTLAGRQRSNEFTQSINDVRTQIQQVVTEIRNGYYPSSNDFSCRNTGSALAIDRSTSVNQGKNTDCVFLGKVMQFNVNGLDMSNVLVYPVAGIRTAATIANADPSVVRNGVVDTSATFKLKYGLTVTGMRANGTSIGAFGVLSSLDSTTPGESGDQQFDIYGLSGTPLNHAKLIGGTSSDDNLVAQFIKNPSGGIQICFKSGGTNQYGLVTVGNNNSQLSVDLRVMDTVCW